MLFALLWNRNLRDFWRKELGEAFFNRMLKLVPYSWMIDPAPDAAARCDSTSESYGLESA